MKNLRGTCSLLHIVSVNKNIPELGRRLIATIYIVPIFSLEWEHDSRPKAFASA